MVVSTQKKSKKVQKVLSHLRQGIEDWGSITSTDFKTWAREFKSMVQEQISLIGGTNYKQNTGHYEVSGFFTVGEQVYYISTYDVRYFSYETVANQVLIRTASSYTDFCGGTNNTISIQDNMFSKVGERHIK